MQFCFINIPAVFHIMSLSNHFHLNYLDSQARANGADPDQTATEEQSDQGLHCLPVGYKTPLNRQIDLSKVRNDQAWAHTGTEGMSGYVLYKYCTVKQI